MFGAQDESLQTRCRLEQAGAGTPQAWVAMQANYDLWQALQHEQPPVRPLASVADAH